ncbi:MAG: hypothetical protein O3B73_16960, partial [bacterium]|nr:hypothetical protein [bacterium]
KTNKKSDRKRSLFLKGWIEVLYLSAYANCDASKFDRFNLPEGGPRTLALSPPVTPGSTHREEYIGFLLETIQA